VCAYTLRTHGTGEKLAEPIDPAEVEAAVIEAL
jgi:hypothetical protein